MEERRYSLVQLSEYSGLSVGELNRITHEKEAERWEPREDQIIKIAKGLRVTTGHLMVTNTKPVTAPRINPKIAANPLPKREIKSEPEAVSVEPEAVAEDISEVELDPVAESSLSLKRGGKAES